MAASSPKRTSSKIATGWAILYERVRVAANEGKSLAETKAIKSTLDCDPLYSAPQWTGEMLARGDLRRRPRAGEELIKHGRERWR